MEKVMGADEKTQLKKKAKESKGLDPVMKRAMDIQAENPKISPAEAVKQANQEWAGRTRLDIGGKPDLESTNEARARAGLPILDKNFKPIQNTVPGAEQSISKNAEGLIPGIEQITKDIEKKVESNTLVKSIESLKTNETIKKLEEKTSLKVPIDTSTVEIQKIQKEGLDKLSEAINEINDNLKLASNTTQKKASGYDANNTRNPILSSIGAGQVTT
jgi:hypothetical protein